MKTLVTGALGYFGTRFVELFGADLGELTLTDRNKANSKTFRFVQCDINQFVKNEDISK